MSVTSTIPSETMTGSWATFQQKRNPKGKTMMKATSITTPTRVSAARRVWAFSHDSSRCGRVPVIGFSPHRAARSSAHSLSLRVVLPSSNRTARHSMIQLRHYHPTSVRRNCTVPSESLAFATDEIALYHAVITRTLALLVAVSLLTACTQTSPREPIRTPTSTATCPVTLPVPSATIPQAAAQPIIDGQQGSSPAPLSMYGNDALWVEIPTGGSIVARPDADGWLGDKLGTVRLIPGRSPPKSIASMGQPRRGGYRSRTATERAASNPSASPSRAQAAGKSPNTSRRRSCASWWQSAARRRAFREIK